MNTDVITDCMTQSFADTPFPVILQKLDGAGVRAYRADLLSLRSTYYDAQQSAFDEAIPLPAPSPVANAFDAEAVSGAVRSIQLGEIGYATFLNRIMQGGCASYAVFLRGRKAVYYGRDGEAHTEAFPPARQ